MTTIDLFLDAVEAATVDGLDVFDDDVHLDATVPNWRFHLRGAHSVRGQLASWFADAGRFETIERVALDDGELVRFELSWQEDGMPYACHQTHRIRLDGDRIVGVTMFCGGRWPAQLLAEMEEASRAAR